MSCDIRDIHSDRLVFLVLMPLMWQGRRIRRVTNDDAQTQTHTQTHTDTHTHTHTHTHISPYSGGAARSRSADRSQCPLPPQALEGRSDTPSPLLLHLPRPPRCHSPALQHSPPTQKQDSWTPHRRPAAIGGEGEKHRWLIYTE